MAHFQRIETFESALCFLGIYSIRQLNLPFTITLRGMRNLKQEIEGGVYMPGNEILVNNMTKPYAGMVQSQLAGSSTKGVLGFKDYVQAADDKSGVSALSAKGMTLDEYKQYIFQKISMIPMHPSQVMRSVCVHISDEGFKAMQADPEYEKWVLDTLRRDFAFNDPWASVCGGSFAVHRFGATKEEYRGYGWYTGFKGGKGKAIYEDEAEESFWDKRTKRFKRYMKMQQKADEKRKIMQRVFEEAAIRQGDIDGLLDAKGLAQSINFSSLLLLLGKIED